MLMRLICPYCRKSFEENISLKSKDGEGRRDAQFIKKLNPLKKKILNLFVSKVFDKPIDKNDLADYVIANVKKRNKAGETINYDEHDRTLIMTEISFLLGLDLLILLKESNPEIVNTETYQWQVNGYRGYWQTEEQRSRARAILDHNGYINWDARK